jgi:hypothetical protein
MAGILSPAVRASGRKKSLKNESSNRLLNRVRLLIFLSSCHQMANATRPSLAYTKTGSGARHHQMTGLTTCTLSLAPPAKNTASQRLIQSKTSADSVGTDRALAFAHPDQLKFPPTQN